MTFFYGCSLAIGLELTPLDRTHGKLKVMQCIPAVSGSRDGNACSDTNPYDHRPMTDCPFATYDGMLEACSETKLWTTQN